MNLAGQFAVVGSVVLIAGMLAIGLWVTRQIENGVIGNTADSMAVYMDSFVRPLVQELAERNTLSEDTKSELTDLLKGNTLGRRIVSFKIWKEGGLVAYSSNAASEGKRLPATPNLDRAWGGEVIAEFDTLVGEEAAFERAARLPLLEIYYPVRDIRNGRVIAVAEFYQDASALKENLFFANLKSWLVVGLVTLVMLTALSGIVVRGSRTISLQRQDLQERVRELSSLLDQNEELRLRVQRASRRTTEINEQYLRRISADLHDGPAQLLALALLRLNALLPGTATPEEDGDGGASDLDMIRTALTDALTDIRSICSGLTLPELDALSPAMLLENAARAHERRTKTDVETDIRSAPETVPKSMKICLYRFVQEGLNNAFRHANGEGQKLACDYDGETLRVEISDRGPGFDPSRRPQKQTALGLSGLRERIESLGGILSFRSAPGSGTRLTMHCPIDLAENTHVQSNQNRTG